MVQLLIIRLGSRNLHIYCQEVVQIISNPIKYQEINSQMIDLNYTLKVLKVIQMSIPLQIKCPYNNYKTLQKDQ
ncbi:unnamed protein product [Paramecium pentaurelia]|uniref:Uncharacterized protein n=1 Tax=Paramecium pentaurelia TaxID=43138 RepID=A0A8S1S1T1_9CILI|nr:unnamed protein product [Paramecium pentaurelia]